MTDEKSKDARTAISNMEALITAALRSNSIADQERIIAQLTAQYGAIANPQARAELSGGINAIRLKESEEINDDKKHILEVRHELHLDKDDKSIEKTREDKERPPMKENEFKEALKASFKQEELAITSNKEKALENRIKSNDIRGKVVGMIKAFETKIEDVTHLKFNHGLGNTGIKDKTLSDLPPKGGNVPPMT